MVNYGIYHSANITSEWKFSLPLSTQVNRAIALLFVAVPCGPARARAAIYQTKQWTLRNTPLPCSAPPPTPLASRSSQTTAVTTMRTRSLVGPVSRQKGNWNRVTAKIMRIVRVGFQMVSVPEGEILIFPSLFARNTQSTKWQVRLYLSINPLVNRSTFVIKIRKRNLIFRH